MKETATGGVLPYMTHLMNDARETIQMRDKRIAELEGALDRIRRVHPNPTKSASEAFFECVAIADAALQRK